MAAQAPSGPTRFDDDRDRQQDAGRSRGRKDQRPPRVEPRALLSGPAAAF